MGNAVGKLENAAGVERAETSELRHPALANIGLIQVVMGMITVFVIWSTAFANLGVTTFPLGIYLLLAAIPLTLCEFSWLIIKCPCCGNEGFCGKVLFMVTFLQGLKRGIAYIILAIPCFIMTPIFISFWAALCGILLTLLGLCYIAKRFQYKAGGGPLPPFSGEPVGAGGQGQPGGMPGGGGGAFQPTPAMMMQDPAVVQGVATGVMAGVQAHQQMQQQQQQGYGGPQRGGYGQLP